MGELSNKLHTIYIYDRTTSRILLAIEHAPVSLTDSQVVRATGDWWDVERWAHIGIWHRLDNDVPTPMEFRVQLNSSRASVRRVQWGELVEQTV